MSQENVELVRPGVEEGHTFAVDNEAAFALYHPEVQIDLSGEADGWALDPSTDAKASASTCSIG